MRRQSLYFGMIALALIMGAAAGATAAEIVAEAWRGGGFDSPRAVAVNSEDGSCWVGDYTNHRLVHLDADGGELWRGDFGSGAPTSLAVYRVDGSCWAVDEDLGWVRHVAADGYPLWSAEVAGALSVGLNRGDGSVWVGAGSALLHYSATGDALGSIAEGGAVSVSVSRLDGSIWAAFGDGEVRHYAPDGTVLWAGDGFVAAASVSVDEEDGSCWIADEGGNQVIHVSAEDVELSRTGLFSQPKCVSANSRDGSCWVADYYNNRVVHLAADGSLLWQGRTFSTPRAVSVDSRDGSCWVADTGHDEVAHLTITLRADFTFSAPEEDPLTVTFTDASSGYLLSSWEWSFGDGGVSQEANPVHTYAALGTYTVTLTVTQLVDELPVPDPVPDTETKSVTLLPPLPEAYFTCSPERAYVLDSIAFTDGSAGVAITAWAWAFGDGATSTQRNPTHAYSVAGVYTISLTLTNAAGSDTETKEECLTVLGFSDVPTTYWAYASIRACARAGIVGGYWDGTYHPIEAVSRAQMAVYIARGLAGGDENVPTGPGVASFADVPTSHWAYKYVEHAKSEGIVQGYWDGYHPAEIVNRAQMAVYIARSICDPTGEAGLVGYVPPTTPSYPDVPADFWAYKYIEYCLYKEVVHGYSDGYRPSAVVDRAMMAVYVQRAFELPL